MRFRIFIYILLTSFPLITPCQGKDKVHLEEYLNTPLSPLPPPPPPNTRYAKQSYEFAIIDKQMDNPEMEIDHLIKVVIRLKITLGIISLFCISLILLMLYVHKQMTALKLAKEGLKITNRNLEVMNVKLNSMNRELLDANLIKEEYVGYFLDLCSKYIGNLEDYRKMVTNKIAAKRFDELQRTASSSSEKGNEIKELYNYFDKAFLKIYPGFVASLNELLKKEERFTSKHNDLLNTELRIFALIRLGITDSIKIASFLRCSVQTVYNYRSKIKHNCLDDITDIEEEIKKISFQKKF